MKVKTDEILNDYCDHLTVGKEYEITPMLEEGWLTILDDYDDEIICSFNNSPHIDASWIVIDEANEND